MNRPRRRFLQRSGALLATATLPTYRAQAATPAGVPDAAPDAAPPLELIALNRMAYGPRPGDAERVQSMGLAAYVEEQLNPGDADDTACDDRVAQARLRIQYAAASGSYEAVNENRPLVTLHASLAELWNLRHPQISRSYLERYRVVDEVKAATWLRAVYSKWQLREVLCEFWHNHFHINAYGSGLTCVVWPIYDRDVIRTHCLGNFRAFLEAVARSTAMQFALDNAFSRASPANENYARELFELHTLGVDHYFNNIYNRWRDVPGAPAGQPVGYIDEDVYEAARCFTGWTIAYGQSNGNGSFFADTGEFAYYEPWHDNYQKRVLGTEIDSNGEPLADGRKVLDLLANHPATARHLCTKLCRRLVADAPPARLVEEAVAVWTEHRDAPDQIKRVVQAILLSSAFASTWGAKAKRPFELFSSLLRATGAEFSPTPAFLATITATGYRHFEWPSPTGHPDVASYWLSTNGMLQRWNAINKVLGGTSRGHHRPACSCRRRGNECAADRRVLGEQAVGA